MDYISTLDYILILLIYWYTLIKYLEIRWIIRTNTAANSKHRNKAKKTPPNSENTAKFKKHCQIKKNTATFKNYIYMLHLNIAFLLATLPTIKLNIFLILALHLFPLPTLFQKISLFIKILKCDIKNASHLPLFSETKKLLAFYRMRGQSVSMETALKTALWIERLASGYDYRALIHLA